MLRFIKGSEVPALMALVVLCIGADVCGATSGVTDHFCDTVECRTFSNEQSAQAKQKVGTGTGITGILNMGCPDRLKHGVGGEVFTWF